MQIYIYNEELRKEKKMLTPKENVLRLYQHKMPEYLPRFGAGIINNVPVAGYYERPPKSRGGKDWFGSQWTFNEGEPAPVPGPNFILEDVCDWREIVKFPDLDDFDWEEAAKIDRIHTFDRDNNALYQMIHNGLFERLHVLMGFENALCALLTDPEEVFELFGAIAEYKCKLIDKIAHYYKPDIISYHDDWGTQRGLFFSPDIWRNLIKPHTKTIVDHVKSKGIIFELHSDGMIKDLVPEVVDDLGVDSIQLMAINEVKELKKITGNKVVYNVFLDMQKYDVLDASGMLTEEGLRSGIRKDVIELAEGGCYIPSAVLVKPDVMRIIEDELDKFRMDLYK